MARLLSADSVQGLSILGAANRLAEIGPNLVTDLKQEPWWEELLESLREPLQLLLLGVGLVYAALGELQDALTILFVILAVAAAEVATEIRAKRAIAALGHLAEPTASVIRESTAVEIPAAEVVPGDLLLLKAGDRVVADIRLIETNALRMDESALSGESTSVTKDAGAILAADTELADRRTMVFSGTTVLAGKGRGLVVATGGASELGRMAALSVSVREPRTPLQVQLQQLARWLFWVALGFSVLVPVLGVLLAGRPVQEMLLTGLTLAFATIPEELPILITIVLGLGAYRLARQNAIVKRLRAAETLGSVSVVATDKTGTLTESRMRLVEIVTAEGRREPSGLRWSEQSARVLEIGILASDATSISTNGHIEFLGDPTETALLGAAEQAGLDVVEMRRSSRILREYPFDDQRKRMSVVVQTGGERRLVLKGSPESVLAICIHDPRDPGGQRALQSADAMAEEGERVLAFAERRLGGADDPLPEQPELIERDSSFAGLAGLADPPRQQVPAAVAALHAAGLRVIMLTGDHPATARAIAKVVGIDSAAMLRGRDLDRLSDAELRDEVTRTSVFARISPEHKLRLV